jgi:hypothetical protein
MVEYVNKGLPIDQRTVAGKSVAQVKEAVRTDLDATAIALLEDDVANAAVIQQMALAEAFKDPDKIINSDGTYHKSLGSYLKFAQLKRVSLQALKKFKQIEPEESKEEDLASMIIDLSNEVAE